MTKSGGVGDAEPSKRARFLSRLEPFRGLTPEELDHIADEIIERNVSAGEVVLVESGPPGAELYVVHSGAVELAHKEAVVAILTSGEIFGYPTLLTGLAPEFTARAREDGRLYCIPSDVALGLLSRPDGVRFVAGNLRERLIQSASTMLALPDVRTRQVTSLVRSDPLFCEPDTPIHDAAQLLMDAGRSAILVRTRDRLGIVTDVDFRDKVVVGGIPSDAPVARIMTSPVHTIGAEVLAPEASIAMMVSGVNHLPVLDNDGNVVGILSASNLMALDARSPFALRRSLSQARDVDELASAAQDIPGLFVDLLDANLDAPALTRILAVLCDTMTARLLEIAIDEHGEPPVPYAWLAFGSAARTELTLASDQDNGLAYDDTDDPSVDEYFRLVAVDVNAGLARCGFVADPHGVLARNAQWRMPLSKWKTVFEYCLEGKDLDRLARASVAFDYRQVAGELYIDKVLTDIMREAPAHPRFMRGLHQLGFNIPSPLGFRGRLVGYVDIKKNGLVRMQNLARYWAFTHGITADSTLERLVAVAEIEGRDPMNEDDRSLREAFTSMLHLQLRHHANAIRNGRPLDNVIDTSTLRPLDHANLQEALRLVAAEQKRFPFLPRL
jgi:CBS domain-containing protein